MRQSWRWGQIPAGERGRAGRWGLVFGLLAGAAAVLAVWNVCSGSVAISPGDVILALAGEEMDETVLRIIWDLRLPRAAAAIVLGGALSVSGFLLQTFFANPIASPFVLGISSGAELAVSFLMIFCLGRGKPVSSLAMILGAFGGAMVATGLVLLLSGRVRSMASLVVCGVMMGYICSAVTDFAVTFADDADIVNLKSWSMGSFSGISWENVQVMAAVVFPALIFVFLLAKPMGVYRLGEVYAETAGVNVRRFRTELILLSSLLSACVVAFAGPVSFVGIAVPHLVKRLLKTSEPAAVIPGCFLGGAAFCLFCDRIARTLFAPTEVSISSVTAVFGAPVVIFMMAGKWKNRGGGM